MQHWNWVYKLLRLQEARARNPKKVWLETVPNETLTFLHPADQPRLVAMYTLANSGVREAKLLRHPRGAFACLTNSVFVFLEAEETKIELKTEMTNEHLFSLEALLGFLLTRL